MEVFFQIFHNEDQASRQSYNQ